MTNPNNTYVPVADWLVLGGVLNQPPRLVQGEMPAYSTASRLEKDYSRVENNIANTLLL
jgi:hypothetical protein